MTRVLVTRRTRAVYLITHHLERLRGNRPFAHLVVAIQLNNGDVPSGFVERFSRRLPFLRTISTCNATKTPWAITFSGPSV